MKLIGVLGGISPVSTGTYYATMNAHTAGRRGGRHSARCLIHSVDFGIVEALERKGDWASMIDLLVDGARSLERGGADGVVLACNTMHHVAEHIRGSLGVPFLHIGDALADALLADGRRRVALLGTRFTMEAAFLRDHLASRGIDVVVPTKPERETVHRVIFDELCNHVVSESSQQAYADLVAAMATRDRIDAVVLGCTEIGVLVEDLTLAVPAYDTALLHARAAVDWALGV